MEEHVLKTNELTKCYRGTNALHNVSITMEAGRIYGLIGQNGAGKTTLMRIIAGHTFPTKGNIALFGCTGEKKLQAERKRLGCMIEYPSLLLNMTAKDNLKYYRMVRGVPNEEICDELLAVVGLADTNKKKVKDFSLGMKQRLGIAIALLSNPELLVLDEPINGLDPLGVIEIRNLLIKLCEERQITILISSHNLPEMYQTATDYIIIHKGEIIKTLTQEQLEENCKNHIRIDCDDPEKLATILETELNTTNYKVLPGKSVQLYDHLNEKERISKMIAEHGIGIKNFSVEGDTLENYFRLVIGGEQYV